MRKLGNLVKTSCCLYALILVATSTVGAAALNAQQALQVDIHWDKVTAVSKSTPTLQVVVNPPLRPGEPLGKAAYKAVKDLGADYVRYVPWLPYPRLAVAELEPPTPQKTILGLQPHRSHDEGFSGRDRRPSRDHQLQHHSCMALQDRKARYLIPPTRTKWSGTIRRAPNCATPPARNWATTTRGWSAGM